MLTVKQMKTYMENLPDDTPIEVAVLNEGSITYKLVPDSHFAVKGPPLLLCIQASKVIPENIYSDKPQSPRG